VTYDGRWHRIRDAGINPLPVQRPIPLWLGGMAEKVVARVGRLADGWFPRFPSMRQRDAGHNLPARDEAPAAIVERMRAYAREAGRDPATIGIEASLSVRQVPEAGWKEYAERWQALGAQSLVINTMSLGLASVDQHLDTLRRVAQALGMRPA
jgi:alkanesulfonate monooxygenase SsuD/methylene tetrahydromethanopterin reductase-like flavin-dependent oxidoreductase (luciferase family)